MIFFFISTFSKIFTSMYLMISICRLNPTAEIGFKNLMGSFDRLKRVFV